jgi:hypothetical protein
MRRGRPQGRPLFAFAGPSSAPARPALLPKATRFLDGIALIREGRLERRAVATASVALSQSRIGSPGNMPFSAYLSHLTGRYENRVRAAFLYPRHYAWHWRIFFVARDLALPVNERLEWTVVSGGAAAPGMLLRALWTTYLSRSKPPNTPEVRSKGVLPRLAGRFSPARFDSYPSHNMPFEAISNVCCADFHERSVVAMEGRRLPSIRLGAFFRFNRISYESDSP